MHKSKGVFLWDQDQDQWSEIIQITDPNLDHPKGMHPNQYGHSVLIWVATITFDLVQTYQCTINMAYCMTI